MTGRYHWRRGNYDFAIDLEDGRKALPHLFKRNNYETILVGKQQPMGRTKLKSYDSEGNDLYFFEGFGQESIFTYLRITKLIYLPTSVNTRVRR